MGNVMYLKTGEVHTAPECVSTDDSDEGRRIHTLFGMKGWC